MNTPRIEDAASIESLFNTLSGEEMENLAAPQDHASKVVARLDGTISVLNEILSQVESGVFTLATPVQISEAIIRRRE